MAKRAPSKRAPQSGRQPRFLDPATLQKLGPLDLIARHVVEGMRIGVHRSPLKGFSTEFAQHRQYVPGDELKHIDWRLYSRSGRYYVKLYEAETDFTGHILLDASRSMQYASDKVSKFDYARFVAASLAYLIVDQRDSAALGVFDSELRTFIEPKSSATVVRHMAQAMEAVTCEPRTEVASILHAFANKIPRRGFVVLISDLLDNVDEFVTGLQHLRFRGHNVIVIHTLDPAELTFSFTRTTRFEGLENDGDLITQPNRVRASYLQELQIFLDRIRVSCERANVEYVLADTSQPVEVVLTEFLRKRSHTAGR